MLSRSLASDRARWITGATIPVDWGSKLRAQEDDSHLVSTPSGWVKPSPHRALDIAEIPGIIEDYRIAAERAKAAEFEGVELHAANGYLIDQFLQDGSNHRTDAYGGSIENRSRLLLQVVKALISVWGGDRVAVRIGPGGTWNGMADSSPQALFDLFFSRCLPGHLRITVLGTAALSGVLAVWLLNIHPWPERQCKNDDDY